MPQSLIIDLHITAEDYLQHYQGSVHQVVCYARDGRRVRFPTGILQRFVSHQGIRGSFKIEIDDGNKLLGIERIA